MTLIAFACHDDHAEILTDTLSYTPNLRHLRSATKYAHLAHLDAAVLAQGSAGFTSIISASVASDLAETFDDLLLQLPGHLEELRSSLQRDDGPDLYCNLAVVGHSAAAGRFVGYTLNSDDGFELEQRDGLYISPAPWSYRPPDDDLADIRDHMIDDPDAYVADLCDGTHTPEQIANAVARVRHEQAALRELHDFLVDLEPPPVPGTHQQWLDLALAARTTRMADTQFAPQWIIGGHLIHGHLTRGGFTATQIGAYDDTGDEFAQLVAGSEHPLAQQGPCGCGSGTPANACCLPKLLLDQPCSCGIPDRTFGTCCYLPPEAVQQRDR